MNLRVIESTPRRGNTLSRSTDDSGSFYRESFSKISASGAAPRARESEVTGVYSAISRFSRKSKSERSSLRVDPRLNLQTAQDPTGSVR